MLSIQIRDNNLKWSELVMCHWDCRHETYKEHFKKTLQLARESGHKHFRIVNPASYNKANMDYVIYTEGSLGNL